MRKRITVAEAERSRISAIRNRRHAESIAESDPAGALGWMATAHRQEQEAAAALALTATPVVGLGGDLVPSEDAIGSYAARLLKSGDVNALHTEAACERIKLASGAQSFELGADAAESMQASDSVEQMLVHQAAALHKHGMQYLARAAEESNTIERCRLANTAARLMGVSQDAVLTLGRKRSGGRQTVLVQHVSVNDGAQAMIANVQTGARPASRGRKPKNG